ncbi:hypothetical protein FU796_07390 [Proteus mirabilis]|uniref:baseplate hub protein n=1 Tax=Proteus mirabilis TaxID=584 RepID=UPI0013DF29E9|nr:hypothetical protein [Proteus mirabilis]QIF48045.1 hypothetical protein FU796_07390 [Proteus mirabilis]
MMDLRRIRVGIEVAERLQWYEGLRIKANGTKYANPLQNECTVSIDGLNAHTRDYLLTETSPYHKSKQTRRLYLEVGRVNTGLFRIFTGDIVSSCGGAMQKMSEIASSVAKDCKVRLDFQATDKNIANWYFCGSALQQVQRLQEAGNVKAFIDDDTLFVKDDNQALKGRLRILSMKSGMVGIPKATEKGLSVTYLIDGASELGGMLRLESKFNSALNGDYIIEQLKFDVASHDDPFFYQATCKRA